MGHPVRTKLLTTCILFSPFKMDESSYNVMFTGTSFMGIYNVGSAQCLVDHGQGVIDRIRCVGGTSAGAITACLLLSSPERLPVCYCVMGMKYYVEKQTT